jgi:hypothetical protein
MILMIEMEQVTSRLFPSAKAGSFLDGKELIHLSNDFRAATMLQEDFPRWRCIKE